MSPPLPSSPVPLGLSFARLASVSPPQNRTNRVQSQSAVKIGCSGSSSSSRDRGDTITGTGNRPTFRSLPYKSPTIPSASFNPDLEPAAAAKTIYTTTPNIPPPEPGITPTTTITTADVIIRSAPIGPRSIGGKPKLQLSLQIPSIPMLGQQDQEEEQQQCAQNRNNNNNRKKPQLPALKLITDTILHPASTITTTTSTSSPSIKLSPSPSSPSPLSYTSYSHPHSPVSPATAAAAVTTNAKPSSSPTQLSSPTHSLFGADSGIHLHPLSLSSPISGSASGSASVRTSVRGWVIGGTTGGGGGVSPGGRSVKSLGGRSVNSLGGRRPRSVRSTRSMRSNRSRRSANKFKIHHSNNSNIPPLSTPDSATCVSTPTPIYSTNAFAYTHLGILGDHVGEFVGDEDGEEKEKNGFVYGGYGYIEDGWAGGTSPSPIRYARSDSRGVLISDTEDDDDGGGGGKGGYEFGVYGGGIYGGGLTGTGDDSAASSEVEFADVDGDSDSDDGRVRRRRRSRKWKGSRDRRGDPPTMTTTTTNPSSPSLPLNLPQFILATAAAASHHSSHPSSNSNPSASSPVSSTSSGNSYSNPYSTRKDRKRARKIQLRSFRNSYRMPPVVPLEQQQQQEERGRGRGEEKKSGGKSNRTSSPAVMKSMIPFRRKTPPPVTGEEQVEQDSASAMKKKKKEGKKKNKSKEKEKDKDKGKPAARATTTTTTTTKRRPTTKSAIDLFNSVSASMSTTYSAASQSASASILSGNHHHQQLHLQSVSSSSSVPPLPGIKAVVPTPSRIFQSTHSQSGSGSTFNTRASSPDLLLGGGSIRKPPPPPPPSTTKKKFAEAVSSALEEVTSRGRASGAPFQPASKTKALTAYSSSSHSIPLDEMEVLDIGRLPGDGGGDGEGSLGDGKTKVPFDEMEVLDISLPGGGGAEAEAEQQKDEKKQGTPPMTMLIKSGDGVRTTSSSLPESDRFSTAYGANDGSRVSASTTASPVVPPPAAPPRPPSSSSTSSKSNSQQPHLKQQFRGSSLGRATTTTTKSSSRRQQYSAPQPYNNRNNNNNSSFQLQPAYTAGISCGLPVSRPHPPRSATMVRSRSRPPPLRLLPMPPFSAPSSGSIVGLEMAVSSSPSLAASSRSVRLYAPSTPPISVPVITVSTDSGTSDSNHHHKAVEGPAGNVEMEGTS